MGVKKVFSVQLLFLILTSGCVQTGSGNVDQTDASETVLSSFQGIGVIDFSVSRNQLRPESSTYISLRIRNNALGKTARNVKVMLDGLGLYSMIDCVGKPIDPNDFGKYYSISYDNDGDDETETYFPDLTGTDLELFNGKMTCNHLYAGAVGLIPEPPSLSATQTEIEEYIDNYLTAKNELFLYDMDMGLTILEHGIEKFFKGDEYDFVWGLQAPSSTSISNIYYKQDVFYEIDYDYSSENFFTTLAVSGNVDRESLNIPTDSSSTAGPIEITQTDIPITIPQQSLGGIEENFVFNIENKGTGNLAHPSSGSSVVIVDIPSEFEVTDNCDNWWSEIDCSEGSFAYDLCNESDKGSIVECQDFAKNTGYLIYKISPDELTGVKTFFVPFKISSDELDYLIDYSIPAKTYVFRVEMNYTYNVEGYTSVHTQPIS